MKNAIVEQVKDYIREPWAFPGGYPLVLVMDDGECLCPACAKDNFKLIVAATKSNARDGWQAAGVQVNWEDNELFCANCDNQLEAAYGYLLNKGE